MENLPSTPTTSLERMQHLPPTFAGVGWYSCYPDHYVGDARAATIEKGVALRQLLVDSLAEYIAAVKADTVLPELEKEFFTRVANEIKPS
jgi:creatinine amidohydrolase